MRSPRPRPAARPSGGPRAGGAGDAVGGPLSVARITGILELLALRSSGESLTNISRELGAPKTSLVGLLKGLQQVGYVVRAGDLYRLGPAADAFAMSLIPGRGFVALAQPLLRELARKTGETALLGVPTPAGDNAIYVDRVESENPVRYTVAVGELRELHCSAVGKCVLAFSGEERIARYLAGRRLVAHTARTITAASELREELKRIRRAGIAYSEDERAVGASAVAAPAFARDFDIIGAFVVGCPTQRFRAHKRTYADAAMFAAKELTRTLSTLRTDRAQA